MSTLAERQREFTCSLLDESRDADAGLAVYRASVSANFSAAQAPLFDFEALARIEPSRYGELRLALHPSVRLLESAHPIGAIREANAPGRDGTAARVEGPDFVLVRSVDGRAVASSLDEREWRLLGRIASGDTLEAALDGEPSGTALAAFVSQGIVVGFTAPACAR